MVNDAIPIDPAILKELGPQFRAAIDAARQAKDQERKGQKPATYFCPTCDTKHKETKTPYEHTVQGDRCSANYRQANGYWRVCHADFKLVGGPNELPGPAYLCTPCWDRQAGGTSKRILDSLLKQLAREDSPLA